MKKSEAAKLVATLAAHYPRQELADASVEAYINGIEDLELNVAVGTIVSITQGSKFFPTVAEIREVYAMMKLGAPDPLHAWAQAVGPPPRHEFVNQAKKLVGDDWAWRNEPEWSHRKPFLEAYAEVLRLELRRIVQPMWAQIEMEAAGRSLEASERKAMPRSPVLVECVGHTGHPHEMIAVPIGEECPECLTVC